MINIWKIYSIFYWCQKTINCKEIWKSLVEVDKSWPQGFVTKPGDNSYNAFFHSVANLENRWPKTFVCKFNLFTCTNPNQPSVLHQRPRVPFYDMGRKKVPCSHYVLRWNVLLVKMMVRKLEWLSHNGIDKGNCSVQQCCKGKIKICQTIIMCSVLKVSKSQK